MPNKVTLELNPNEVEELVDKLSIQDKIRLVRKLENETWARRLDEVVSRIRKRFKQTSISDKEIRQICEETRQRLYNERVKNRN
jgi:ribosomal protein L31E